MCLPVNSDEWSKIDTAIQNEPAMSSDEQKKEEDSSDPNIASHSSCTIDEAYDLCFSVADPNSDKGCIEPTELKNLLEIAAKKKFQIIAYDGFEPSGRMHIAQGVMKALNVNKLTRAGIKFKFLVADWFAQLNDKMGGDIEKIKILGKYFLEIWKSVGMELDNVEFIWTSTEVNKRSDEYWTTVMDLARKFSIPRIQRCGTIMGKSDGANAQKKARGDLLKSIFENREADKDLSEAEFEEKYALDDDEKTSSSSESNKVSSLLYPLMQCTDIFFLNASVCQLGLDQLKVNVLAREYVDVLKKKKDPRRKMRAFQNKPVILSHHMLAGLKGVKMSKSDPDAAIFMEAVKMSKSDPDAAIFMEDDEVDVNRKVKKAFCRPQNIELNPVLEYCKFIIFPWKEQKAASGVAEFLVERDEGDGGDITYSKYQDLEDDFASGKMHPSSLKPAVAREINDIIQPVRDHFATGDAKALLKRVKQIQAWDKKRKGNLNPKSGGGGGGGGGGGKKKDGGKKNPGKKSQ